MVYFFQGSKTLLALLVPIFAVFASAHGAFLVSITLILMSTTFLLISCKQKPIMLFKESQIPKIDFSPQENTLIRPADSSCDVDLVPVPTLEAEADMKREDGKDQFLIASQDLYSESDQFSTSSSEDHSSDIEWPYNMGQRLDCSDDSISDEESLIEIAIPTGQFVKDFKCCKLSHQESIFQKDFWADMNEMNEEDNLIEIDIYMGSIKL
ncbi:hypothetical protein ACS0TY_017970 [Phlomoides rotata]